VWAEALPREDEEGRVARRGWRWWPVSACWLLPVPGVALLESVHSKRHDQEPGGGLGDLRVKSFEVVYDG